MINKHCNPYLHILATLPELLFYFSLSSRNKICPFNWLNLLYYEKTFLFPLFTDCIFIEIFSFDMSQILH